MSRWLGNNGFVLLNYNYPDRRYILDLCDQLQQETDFGLSPAEAHILAGLVISTNKLNGVIAEIGVYEGGSAKLICEHKGERHLYLFDTFEGFPTPSDGDSPYLEQGQCKSDLTAVSTYLSRYPNIHITAGLFPATGRILEGKLLALVHLDVDLLESTSQSLAFIWDKLIPGGVVLIHDYKTLEGVKTAVDRFFADKQAVVVILPTSQCLVVKG